MKLTKTQLKQIIEEELTNTINENDEYENQYLGLSVNEIANMHINRWDETRQAIKLAHPGFPGRAFADAAVNEMVDFTIQIMYKQEIKDKHYPHLSEVEYNELIEILKEDRRMNTPSGGAKPRPSYRW